MPTQSDQNGFTFNPPHIPSPSANPGFTPVTLPATSGVIGASGANPNLFPTQPFVTPFTGGDPALARPTWARQPMIWELYDGTMVEMYVNPQNVSIQSNKKITQGRTKGGFVVQYWGEELITMSLNGTTGSSGIEGIELLYDVYQSELLPAARLDELRNMQNGYHDVATKTGVNPGANGDKALLGKVRRSDLVSRATQVCLWYGNFKRYYGFFQSFNIQEAAANPGEYIYALTFMIWKTVGRDRNYMPWHRTPSPLGSGQSGVPEHDGNVSIYAIQGASQADTQSTANDSITSQGSPSAVPTSASYTPASLHQGAMSTLPDVAQGDYLLAAAKKGIIL